MLVFSSYAMQIVMAFMMLIMIFMMSPRAIVSAKRILEVLETESTINDGTLSEPNTGIHGEVEFKNVSFKYPDSEEYMIHDVSFKAKEGETVALIGATGCGKSTVVNLIPRFYDVTEGEVLVNGVNVREYKKYNLNNLIGYVSQKSMLFGGSIRSNIAYGDNGKRNLIKSDIVEAAITAQSSDFIETMENGYNSFVTQRVTKNMREEISKKMNRLPMWYYNRTSTGEIMSGVTNDVDTISQSLNQSIGTLVTSSTLLLGSLIMMLKTNKIMTLTAVLSIIMGFGLMALIMSKSQKYFAEQQSSLGKLNGHIEEIYAGHTIVKSYNGETQARNMFLEFNNSLRESGFKAQCLSGMMMPIMSFIGNLGYVAVCIVGAILAINGSISFGVIVAFMMYIRYFTQPLSQIAQAAQSMQAAAAAGERIFEFLEEEEMEDESYKTHKVNNIKGNVEFENVSFAYEETDKKVINNFSVKVKPGQKIAIVGPTGSGKTTLINLLMLFHEMQSGEIRIEGTPINKLSREEVRSQFCMVLQDTWLFEGTIMENIIYSTKNVSVDKAIAACKSVGLHHFIKTLPKGYDTILNDQVNLSVGQKQQLTIARAMISDKSMLILDEATSSVDTRTEQSAMDELMKGRTSFIIAHRL